MPYSVLLVDDHRIVLEGIRAILDRTADFHVVGEAETGRDAMKISSELRPDLILMDIGLSGINGIDTTEEIIRHNPGSRVIILSIHDDENTVVAALRCGARAFIVKKASSADLLDAMRTVAQGGSYLSAHVSDHLLRRLQRTDLETRETRGPLDGLSPRERQVLRLVAEGKTSKEIAAVLKLGIQTVRTYRKSLMKKVDASSVARLTQVAISAGLTRLSDNGAE